MRIVLFVAFFLWASKASALTASKVWYEFHPKFYRIYIRYTVPDLREAREAYIDLRDKRQAETFFWSLVRGADFYLRDGKVEFVQDRIKPDPW